MKTNKFLLGVFLLALLFSCQQQQELGERLQASRRWKELDGKTRDSITSQATQGLRKRVDDIEKTTWFEAKETPKTLDQNSFHIYIGLKDGVAPWLRMRIQYSGEDWLFVQGCKVKADDSVYSIPISEVKRDNNMEGVYEWIDNPVDQEGFSLVGAIARSKQTKLRLVGANDHANDREITKQEKEAISLVLEAFKGLTGKTGK